LRETQEDFKKEVLRNKKITQPVGKTQGWDGERWKRGQGKGGVMANCKLENFGMRALKGKKYRKNTHRKIGGEKWA